MKKFSKIALVFVFILSFGLFLGGCAFKIDPLDVNVNENQETTQTSLSYKNLKALLDKDIFANWEVVQMCDKNKRDGTYLTYYYLGDNSTRMFEYDGFDLDDEKIIEYDIYSVNGIDYITDYDEWGTPSEKTKSFSENSFTKEVALNYMNSAIEKIGLCYIENTYTKTADGFKVEVDFDPTWINMYGFCTERGSYDSFKITFDFDENNELLAFSMYCGWGGEDDEYYYSYELKEYNAEVPMPEDFDPSDYVSV